MTFGTSSSDAMRSASSRDEALRACGWQRSGSQEVYTWPDSLIELRRLNDAGSWRRYVLHGHSLPRKRAQLLAANLRFKLPAKFVQLPAGPACCLDAPDLWLATGDRAADSQAATCPHTAWAQAITRHLGGQSVACRHHPVESLLEVLQQQGIAASIEEQSLLIHLHFDGGYRQLRVETNEHGYRLLVDLAAAPEPNHRKALQATAEFAMEANRKLPLAAFGRADGKQCLQATVAFNFALIPDAWFLAAVLAVEDAVKATARELEALRDPELAHEWLASLA